MQEAQMLRIPLAFKMDIILEKITTNPPINKIVEVALVILSANISPKLEKDAILMVCLLESVCVMQLSEVFFRFQNLKTIPTVIQESK